MVINWFGQNCFKIIGDKVTLIFDPFDSSIGLKVPRFSADIVLLTEKEMEKNAEDIKGLLEKDPFIISGPGEYEVHNVLIHGVESEDRTVYRTELDGISLGVLGRADKALSGEELEIIEGVDILFCPIGGGNSLDAKTATSVISQVEPRIVIPCLYQIKGLKSKENIEGVDKFCKEIGVCPTENIDKYKIVKKDLPADDLRVIILAP